MSQRRKYHTRPFPVVSRERRTYKGVVYASKTEMLWAQVLDGMVMAGVIQGWKRQVPIPLGLDKVWIVDFVVTGDDETVWVDEVKGFNPASFRDAKKLWRKYGPYNLRIRRLNGKRWTTEIIPGGRAS